MATNFRQGPFSAEIAQDPELDTTVVSLSYTDTAHPERSLTASVAPDLGSNLFRFRVGEHDLIYRDTELLKKRDFTGVFVLWPVPNRLRNKRYTFEGQAYSLADRVSGDDPSLVHGLVYDRSWHYQQPVIKDGAAVLTTYIDIDKNSPFYAGYPFDSRLSLTYTLTSAWLEVTYNVENKGMKTLPYGFALHPYFSLLSGRDQTTIALPANGVMEADNALLPTGRLLDVRGTMYSMYDLRAGEPVSHLKLDHVFTDLIPDTPALIQYHKDGLQLEIKGSKEFTHAVVYTPADAAFACVEYQTCSTDALNFATQDEVHQRLAHLLTAKPGETGSGTLRYTPQYVR